MIQNSDDRFAKARELFPHTKNVVYFNSASYGPFNTKLKDAIEENIAIRVGAESDDSHDNFVTQQQLREDYAGLIGAKGGDVGVGLSTSFGLNIAAFGLPLERGDEMLVSDVEFPALVYTFRAAAEERGLKLSFVKSRDRFFDVDELRRSITPKSKVLALSYVQYFNGFKNDLREIGEICREHGLYFVVDGIQGMGAEPLNVAELPVDIFSSGCQKWMLSPQGCGFFYLSEGIRRQLSHPFMSWQGVDWKMDFTDLFRYDLPYFTSARRFELGYYATLNLIGMKASVEIFKDLGIDNIQRHNHSLLDRLVGFLKGNSYYTITSSLERRHRSSILSFACEDVVGLHRELLKNKIILVRREGSIRVSVHLFNNEQDMDRLIEVLDKYARKG